MKFGWFKAQLFQFISVSVGFLGRPWGPHPNFENSISALWRYFIIAISEMQRKTFICSKFLVYKARNMVSPETIFNLFRFLMAQICPNLHNWAEVTNKSCFCHRFAPHMWKKWNFATINISTVWLLRTMALIIIIRFLP